MITIQEATVADIKTIQDIANRTWPIAYGEILSKNQLDYMMDLIYSELSLIEQMQKKEQLFYIAYDSTIAVAFMAIEHNYKNEKISRVHKIYILPETQGKGIGKLLIDFAENAAKENQARALSLNVNRYNKALLFYQKLGFKIIAEENIEIGEGYLMEDYRMEKRL